MVQYTYSTINETILESSGTFHYSYNTIEVIQAKVISINNPEKTKDVTTAMNKLILKSRHSNTNSSLTINSGEINKYTNGDIDFGSRKKIELQLMYGNRLRDHGHTHGHL